MESGYAALPLTYLPAATIALPPAAWLPALTRSTGTARVHLEHATPQAALVPEQCRLRHGHVSAGDPRLRLRLGTSLHWQTLASESANSSLARRVARQARGIVWLSISFGREYRRRLKGIHDKRFFSIRLVFVIRSDSSDTH